jgi:hypothetical protein
MYDRLTKSSYGVDVYVESDAVNHACWNGKKEDDLYAQKIGLHVIPIVYVSSTI